MEHFIVRGYPTQVNWTFNNIAGSSFSLAGYSCRLYYSMGAATTLATGVTHFGNVLTWTFTPDDQWKLGYYDLTLELYVNGALRLTVTYPNAFQLIKSAAGVSGDISDTSTATQTDYATLNIVSSIDFNRFSVVLPTVGEDGYWYLNGEVVTDESGNPVSARGPAGVGISDFAKTGTSGLVDTYTITFTNGTTKTIDVTNGKDGVGISSISKTGTEGNVDTYTILFTDGTSTTFTVTNAKQMTLDDVPTQDSSNPVKSSGLYAMYRYITATRLEDNRPGQLRELELDTSCRINSFYLANMPQYLAIQSISKFREWWLCLKNLGSGGAASLIIKEGVYRLPDGERAVVINGEYIPQGLDHTLVTLDDYMSTCFIHIIDDGHYLNFEFVQHS